jgi:hypothetical protein
MEVIRLLHIPVALTPVESPGTHRIVGCLGPRTSLGLFAEEKNLVPSGVRTADRPAPYICKLRNFYKFA